MIFDQVLTKRINISKFFIHKCSAPALLCCLDRLTVDSEVHGASVLAGDKGVFPSIAPVSLRDGEAVQLSDGCVTEPFLHGDLDFNAVPQPAALHVILVHLKLKGGSLFLKNLEEQRGGVDADGRHKQNSKGILQIHI